MRNMLVASRKFNRLSLRCRVMLIIVALIALPTELTMRGIFAREYYYLSVKNLQLIALTAIKIGVEYLPADPHAAVRVADAYAESQGIARAEIIFTEVSSDNTTLKIGFDRKIPGYVAVLTMGGLPGRDINVTASAWRQDAEPVGDRDLMISYWSATTLSDVERRFNNGQVYGDKVAPGNGRAVPRTAAFYHQCEERLAK